MVRNALVRVKKAMDGREPRALLGAFCQKVPDAGERIEAMRVLAGVIRSGGHVSSLSTTWPAQYLVEWTLRRERTKEDVAKALRDAITFMEKEAAAPLETTDA